MKEISESLYQQLLVSTPIRKRVSLHCECGSKLDMGYCRNPDCVHDAPIAVYDCPWCGCCPEPKSCVWSVTCPICGSVPKRHCTENGRLVGLHQERWDFAKSSR